MITVRRAGERGHTQTGWLDSRHTFSFGDYYDPAYLGFRSLRVINDDRVSRGSGFGTHPHRDMEIITYVLEGSLAHKDSLGNGSVIRPGEVQRMSAGTGIRHSEYNHSRTDSVHFLQIWILPEATGLPPGYEQKAFAPEELAGGLRLVASRDGRAGSVTVHQNVDVYAARLEAGDRVEQQLSGARHAWLHVASGRVRIGDLDLAEGDGVALEDEAAVRLTATRRGEVLLFDLMS